MDHIDTEDQAPQPTPIQTRTPTVQDTCTEIPLQNNPTLQDPRQNHGMYKDCNIPQTLPEKEANELVDTLKKMLEEDREDGEITESDNLGTPDWHITSETGSTTPITQLLPPIEIDFLEYLSETYENHQKTTEQPQEL